LVQVQDVLQDLELFTVMLSASDPRCFGILLNVEWQFVTDVVDPTACPEASVSNFHSILRKIRKERGSADHHQGAF
jgi:hypothetical protein